MSGTSSTNEPIARERTGSKHPGEPETQVRQAYIELEERIATLALAPGQIVSENSLAVLLGLGRTPVREALQHLAREGLVSIHPKRGVMITEIDVKRQLKMLELRSHVERYVVEAATAYATGPERQRFREIAGAMERASESQDGDAFLALDREFNQLLLLSARNEFATGAMKLIQGLSRRFWYAFGADANLTETAHLHARIAMSIGTGELAEALVWFKRLMDNVEAFTRASLDRR